MIEEEINQLIKQEGVDTNKISDGYHTFGELYEHRIVLFIALCHVYQEKRPHDLQVWKSKVHSDGSVSDGWFIAGMGKEEGLQITYHLPMDKWDSLKVEELDKAPEWDGHTPQDVLERIIPISQAHTALIADMI